MPARAELALALSMLAGCDFVLGLERKELPEAGVPIDSLHDAAPDAAVPCPFRGDDFNATAINLDRWEVTGDTSQTSGALHFTLLANVANKTSTLRSKPSIRRGDIVTVQLLQPPTASVSDTALTFDTVSDKVYRFEISLNTSLHPTPRLKVFAFGQQPQVFDYTPGVHRYFSIFHVGSDVVFAAHEDRMTRIELTRLPGVANSEFYVGLTATVSNTAAQSTVTWDDLFVTCL